MKHYQMQHSILLGFIKLLTNNILSRQLVNKNG